MTVASSQNELATPRLQELDRHTSFLVDQCQRFLPWNGLGFGLRPTSWGLGLDVTDAARDVSIRRTWADVGGRGRRRLVGMCC